MRQPMTVPAVRDRKAGGGEVSEGSMLEPLVMVTAHDAPSARTVDEAGVDIILVGDSLAMTVLGYDDTLQVSLDDMVHHTAAVARAGPRALVVTDMPWLSYHTGVGEAVLNAGRLVRAGSRAVKVEGGAKRLPVISALLDAEIPVMGHVGLTPQSVNALGGYTVQANDADAARHLVDDAVALAEAGCFAIVLEAVPDQVGRLVTEAVRVPTVGIGAGPWCDGQVLVFHDLLGLDLGLRSPPTFVRRYAELAADGVAAVSSFAADVRARRFPSGEESYHLSDDAARLLVSGRDGTDLHPPAADRRVS